MNTIDWAKGHIGQQLTDNSGNYPGECVSFFKRAAQETQGVPNADSTLFVPDGRAKNIWYQFTSSMANYYDKVTSPQPGDWAIYDGLYGDVALCLGGGQVIGQLGTPVFKPVAIRSIGSPIGYLRRKGNDVSTVGEVEFNDLYRAFFGPKQMDRQPPTDYDRRRWIGNETNTVIREMEADDRRGAFIQFEDALEKAVNNPDTSAQQKLNQIKGIVNS